MLGITLGASCAPIDGACNLGSLSLSATVLLSPLAVFGPLFSRISSFFDILSVFVCWGGGGGSHMFGITLGTGCAPKEGPHSQRWSPSPDQSRFVGECCSDSLWLSFAPCSSESSASSILCLWVCLLRFGGCFHMFRITLGTRCAPQHLGSLSLLENDFLMSSSCLLDPCFPKCPVSCILRLCVGLLRLGGGALTCLESPEAQAVLPNKTRIRLTDSVCREKCASDSLWLILWHHVFQFSRFFYCFSACLFAELGGGAPACLESP